MQTRQTTTKQHKPSNADISNTQHKQQAINASPTSNQATLTTGDHQATQTTGNQAKQQQEPRNERQNKQQASNKAKQTK
jgi:hypothetical protein